jgi:hypothetical protein
LRSLASDGEYVTPDFGGQRRAGHQLLPVHVNNQLEMF